MANKKPLQHQEEEAHGNTGKTACEAEYRSPDQTLEILRSLHPEDQFRTPGHKPTNASGEQESDGNALSSLPILETLSDAASSSVRA